MVETNQINGIEFNTENHTYTRDGKKLISATQLMRKHGLAPDYAGIPEDVLKKAADRGTLIHEEIEMYLKKGEEGFTKELYSFIDWYNSNGITYIESEYIAGNDIVAGQIDLIFVDYEGNLILADHKTTSECHKGNISWQLSIYDALYHEDVPNANFKAYKCLWYHKDGTLEIVDIEKRSKEEVEALFEAERNGTKYEVDILGNTSIDEVANIAKYIKDLEAKKKAAEDEYNALTERLREEMEKRDLKEFRKGNILITCKGAKKASTRTSTKVDLAKFEAENPEAFSTYKSYEYKVTTDVKATPNKIEIIVEE